MQRRVIVPRVQLHGKEFRADVHPLTGIRRQSRHSVPGNLGQERLKRRASVLDYGSANQGKNGNYNGKQQTNGAGRTRSGGSVRFGWRMLLDEFWYKDKLHDE